MLPKELRIRHPKEFERVYKKGSSSNGSLLFVKYLKNNLSFSRFGIVISKKVSKKAVERNKIKRRAREAARTLYEKAPKGYDIVINIKRDAKEASFQDISKELAAHLRKVASNEKNNTSSN